jgi:hypothetical protein
MVGYGYRVGNDPAAATGTSDGLWGRMRSDFEVSRLGHN